MSNPLEFDPLEAILEAPDEAISAAKKREIKNILKSYVGLHDSFCELIQNAMDSVEKREINISHSNYKKKILINVDLEENSFTVIDNGTGFSQNEFKSFIAPNISFKVVREVGATKELGRRISHMDLIEYKLQQKIMIIILGEK